MAANQRRRLLVLALASVLAAVVGFGLLRPGATRSDRTISLDDLAQRVKRGDVVEIRVADGGGVVRTRSGDHLSYYTGQGGPVLKVLASFGATPDELANVTYTVADPPAPWIGLLMSFGPLALFGAIMLFALRRMGDRGTNPLTSFGRSRARVVQDRQPAITFVDVAGVDEPRQELQEIVEFLKEPQKFAALGARIPRGVLLVGPPGTGKTLLARAVAGEDRLARELIGKESLDAPALERILQVGESPGRRDGTTAHAASHRALRQERAFW